jgi:hypothetical protein
MLYTTPIAATIRHLISTGTSERELLAAVASRTNPGRVVGSSLGRH